LLLFVVQQQQQGFKSIKESQILLLSYCAQKMMVMMKIDRLIRCVVVYVVMIL